MLVLYPNFRNQSSFSTNHLEAGEHVGSKSYRLKRKPADFTVPLVRARAQLRGLWADAGGRVLSAQQAQQLEEGAAWAWRAAQQQEEPPAERR